MSLWKLYLWEPRGEQHPVSFLTHRGSYWGGSYVSELSFALLLGTETIPSIVRPSSYKMRNMLLRIEGYGVMVEFFPSLQDRPIILQKWDNFFPPREETPIDSSPQYTTCSLVIEVLPLVFLPLGRCSAMHKGPFTCTWGLLIKLIVYSWIFFFFFWKKWATHWAIPVAARTCNCLISHKVWKLHYVQPVMLSSKRRQWL